MTSGASKPLTGFENLILSSELEDALNLNHQSVEGRTVETSLTRVWTSIGVPSNEPRPPNAESRSAAPLQCSELQRIEEEPAREWPL